MRACKNHNIAGMKKTHQFLISLRSSCISFLLFWLFFNSFAQKDSLAIISKQNQIIFKAEINHTEDWKGLKHELKKIQSIKNAQIFASKSTYWRFYSADGELITGNIEAFSVDKNLGIIISKDFVFGLIDKSGKLIAQPLCTEIKAQDGYFLGKEQNLISIKNESGQLIKELRYSNLQFLSKRYGVYGVDKRFGIINLENYEPITKPIYDEVSLFNDTSFLVKSGNKKGLVNFNNELLIPIEYASIIKDTLNFIKIARERVSNGKTTTSVGICNYKGRVLIPLIYKTIGEYTNGLFPAQNEKYWGYLNAEGQQVIPFFYDTYGKFVSGLAAVFKNGLVGIIDMKGSWVAFPEYEKVQYVNDTMWIWSRAGLSGFYSIPDKKGIPYMYEALQLLNGNFVRFTQSGKYGLLATNRKTILNAEWDNIEIFEDEKIIIASRNSYFSIFYLNGNLKVFMNYPFSKFEPYRDGMAMVVQKGKYGFIDRDGLLLVSTQYDEARPYSNGLAAIRIAKNWGFVDKQEHFIANPYYDMVNDFDFGAAIVQKNGKFGLVNKQGIETLKPQLDAITILKSGNYLLKKDGRFGIANSKGIETINPIYKDILELKSGVFRVRLYGKYSLVDLDHKLLTTSDFDNIEYGNENGHFIYTTKFEWKALK
ncbi:MAG: WG repeat-containing protein [Cytophagales bacterium]